MNYRHIPPREDLRLFRERVKIPGCLFKADFGRVNYCQIRGYSGSGLGIRPTVFNLSIQEQRCMNERAMVGHGKTIDLPCSLFPRPCLLSSDLVFIYCSIMRLQLFQFTTSL